MIYKDFKGKKISALGMGCMRFPVIDGDGSKIDEALTQEMFDYAIENGINYFDTAWGYHHGNSETTVGKLLCKYPRENFYIATKFPGYDLSNMGKAEQIFTKQLERCRVEYFDFYLVHNVCEMNIDAYLDDKYGDVPYLIEQKRCGKIKHLGFSTHGSLETMQRFIDKYGKDMEFCQLQINYLDWSFQNAKQKVELVTKHNLPVWVMEPIRGGKLANPEPKYVEDLQTIIKGATMPELAFRFIQSVPEAVVTLSGMSDFAQLKENIHTFSEDKPLNTEQLRALLNIADRMLGKKVLPCTSCEYCAEHCPKELDIPWLISLYNEHSYSDGGFIAPMAMSALEEGKKPSACIGCRSCEAVCPQQIKISEMMTDFTKRLK